MSLQLDNGRLKCLPHPAESFRCEEEGITLAQATERGRLYRETFYVCRNCGKDGGTIEKIEKIMEDLRTFPSIRAAMKWGWGSAAVIVPFLVWVRWWEGAAVIGITLLASPGIYSWENRKMARALAARGLPRADAPGLLPVAAPTIGCRPQNVLGQRLPAERGRLHATGPCCDKPDWIEAWRVTDEDRVPCPACGRGVMVVSELSMH